MVKGAGEDPEEPTCRREFEVVMLRMEPGIESSRTDGDDTTLFRPSAKNGLVVS